MDTATKSPQEPRAKNAVSDALTAITALLDRAMKQIHSLENELQSEVARQLEQELTATRTAIEEQFRKKVADLSAEWQAERERLTAELAHRTQTAAQWETERSRLYSEIERLRHAQAATQTEAQRAISMMKQAGAGEGTFS